ncbi:9656_t:CDS:1, partial [Racocetra persica]
FTVVVVVLIGHLLSKRNVHKYAITLCACRPDRPNSISILSSTNQIPLLITKAM